MANNNMNSGGSAGGNGATQKMLNLDPDDHVETRSNVSEAMNRRSDDSFYNSNSPTRDMLSEQNNGPFED